jgi:translation elongation factor EF-1alpha
VPVARRFEMQVVVLDVAVPVLKGQPLTLHAHCAREAGHITALVALLNAKTGGRAGAAPRRRRPRSLRWLRPALRQPCPRQGRGRAALRLGPATQSSAGAGLGSGAGVTEPRRAAPPACPCCRPAGEVQRQRPRCLTKGQTALVEVTPARGLCLEEAADYRSLGRVALREGGRTVAVGLVTKILE